MGEIHTKDPMRTRQHPRTVEDLVEERVRRWELVPAHEGTVRRLPVVAISRQAGSLGEKVARRLARELGMDLYADQLIGLIAETTHVSERVVRTLDEKGVRFVDDMLATLIGKYSLVSDAYFDALAKTIATIDWHGNAVVVGRGAAYMVHARDDLKIRFIAPFHLRVKYTMRELGLSEDEAKKHVVSVDADHARFVHHYFRTDDDVHHFDLTVNNESMDLDASVGIVRAALQRKMQGRE